MTVSESAEVVVPLTGSSYSALRYSAATLETIRRHTVDKFLSIPRGGLEVGGLLLGRVIDDVIEIVDSEEFTIEYSSGPSYRLSPGDEDTFRERLRQPPEVVGWWHSHTRSEANLSDEDLRVHKSLFPDPHALALIIKPFKFEPAQVAVYLPNASSDPFAASGRFVLDAPDVPPRVQKETQPEPQALAPVVVPLVRRPPPAVTTTTGKRRRLVAVAVLALLSAGIAWFALPSRPAPEPNQPLGLRLSDSANQLTVHWDRNASAIQSSIAGELIVVDGSHVTQIPLGVDSLNTGTLAYVRRSGKVEVRLRARSRDNELHEAVAHFVGPTPEPVTVTRHAVEEDPNIERMRAEVERLNTELTKMRSATAKPMGPAPAPTPVKITPAPFKAPPPRTTNTPAPQAAVVASPPPTIPIQQSSIPSSAPVTPQMTAPPPPAQQPVVQTPAAPKALARGKAIWTGTLPRGAVLLVDGRRPSTGALTGRMPDGPSRMRIYPADLRESGIMVYTQADKERIETPSAANGWNLTTYRPDAKRARDITVLEAPSAANNWQRIMVRSEQRPLSMLVLEWEEVR